MFQRIRFRSSKRKLTFLLLVPVIGMLVSAGWGLDALHQAQARTSAARQTDRAVHAGIRVAQEADRALARQARALAEESKPGGGQESLEAWHRDGAAISDQLRELASIMARLKLSASGVDEAGRRHAELVARYSADANSEGAGQRLSQPYAALGETMRQAAATLEKFAQQETRGLDAANAAQFDRMAAGLALVIVLTSALGIYLRVTIRRNILDASRAGADAAQRVAEGDLTVQIEVPSNGQTKATLAAMKRMVEDLRTLVSGVAHSARTVADASAQIAQGNLDLSQRTEEQASTLEETASSMEELSSTVMHTADNARQASRLAVGASDVARRGGQAVGEVVATMTGISESSRRIGDITGVIDGIAFQTNILALNAAVEAARAGDQGRGFAVVAAEVRSLAQRSAAAAKEIKGLIGASVHQVETGTRQVDAAGKAMEEIVSAVRKVSDLVAEIAAATQEQSSGIGQVNTAVTQLEQVMQQNASLAEEATAATESLKVQADSLLLLVSRFKLGEQQGAFTAVRAVRSGSTQPIQVRRSAKPAPAYAALGAYSPAASRKGEWEEF